MISKPMHIVPLKMHKQQWQYTNGWLKIERSRWKNIYSSKWVVNNKLWLLNEMNVFLYEY